MFHRIFTCGLALMLSSAVMASDDFEGFDSTADSQKKPPLLIKRNDDGKILSVHKIEGSVDTVIKNLKRAKTEDERNDLIETVLEKSDELDPTDLKLKESLRKGMVKAADRHAPDVAWFGYWYGYSFWWTPIYFYRPVIFTTWTWYFIY